MFIQLTDIKEDNTETVDDTSSRIHITEDSFAKQLSSSYFRNTSAFKKLTLVDILPYIRNLNQCPKVSLNDIPKLDNEDNLEKHMSDLEELFLSHENCKLSFFKKLFITFKSDMKKVLLAIFLDSTLRISYTIFMGEFISNITFSNLGHKFDKRSTLISAFFFILICIVALIPRNFYFTQVLTTAGKIRLTLTAFLYKKINCLSLTSLKQVSLGKVINLVANDLNDIENGPVFVGAMIMTPYMLLIATFVMWRNFGASCLVGISTLFMYLFIQIYLAKKTSEPRRLKNKITDERIKKINELIESIRLIKTNAWELYFTKPIEELRKKEYNQYIKLLYIDTFARSFSIVSDHSAIFFICTVYTLTGGILSPDKIYSTLVILSYLSYFAMLFFQQGRMYLVNLQLVLKRVEEIYNIPDLLRLEDQKVENEKPDEQIELSFENYSSFWSNENQKPCIKNISASFQPGILHSLIGKIGSGKTSFFLSIIGETPKTEGKIKCKGKIAYVEQDPVIFSGSIRWNILFGNKYDADFYKRIIENCNLLPDFEIFQDGDQTLIGERGINLSGGQKARISLARALYSRSDIFLLDDPFAALDAKISRSIFEKVIKGDILKDKIVILATHHLHFAQESECVLVMQEGEIIKKGTFEEINKSKLEMFKILPDLKSELGVETEFYETEIVDSDSLNRKEKKERKEILNLSTWDTYYQYFKTEGTLVEFISISVLLVSYSSLTFLYSRFLGTWAQEHSRAAFQKSLHNFSNWYYIKICIIFLVSLYVIGILKRIAIGRFLLKTNSKLHEKMSHSISRAKIEFFDKNPVGAILSRFSNDMGILDKPNLITFFDTIDGTLQNFSLLLIICLYNPIILIPVVVIAVFLFNVKKWFEKSFISCKEFDLSSRIPIFSLFSSTLHGLYIIRSYRQGMHFLNQMMTKVYENMLAYSFFIKSSRLFTLILDTGISAITVSGIIYFSVAFYFVDIQSSIVGLSFLYLIQIIQESSYTVRQTILLDINMQSTQRILDYINLSSEPPVQNLAFEDELKSKNWPNQGGIQFNNVSMRYGSNSPLILKGIDFKIEPGSKVAIVGRSGAGKSSIIQALLRFVEIEPQSSIKIDGIDIKYLGLHQLRSKMFIIPQNPVIFSGTIRRNLDPVEKYKNEEEKIWEALTEVGLGDFIKSLDNGLNTDMSMSSSIFSTGQKQLLWLARGLLNQAKILILDEATANVDLETDKYIQEKIIEKFNDSTILTIAHRLITVAHYDKLLVLHEGNIVEFENPYKLLVNEVGDNMITNKNGFFARMVSSTGLSMSNKIFEVARKNFYDDENYAI